MSNNRLIVRLSGGIGNQLFEYAAARRLSIKSEARLVIDAETGFERDFKYRRAFSLTPFQIKARFSTDFEKLKPFRSVQKSLVRFFDQSRPFSQLRYVKQEFGGLDERILNLTPVPIRWLDGIWNSESYFKDEAATIYNELQIDSKFLNLEVNAGEQLKQKNSVAIHFRFFSSGNDYSENLQEAYYKSAIEYISSRVDNADFYVFSDNLERALSILQLMNVKATITNQSNRNNTDHEDLWLMSKCRHIIAANSTFSWWGAWLGEFNQSQRITIVPDPKTYNQAHWVLPNLIPERWIKLG